MNIERSSFLAGLALVILGSAPVMAADMPLPTYPPAFTWTGFYGGANVGWHWDYAHLTGSEVDDTAGSSGPTPYYSAAQLAAVSAALPVTLRETGLAAGLQWGYNYQIVPLVVIGVEGDLSGLSGSAGANSVASLPASTTPASIPAGTSAFISETATDRWMATLRLRSGLSFDRALIYVTGGAAMARWSLTPSYSDNATFPASGGFNIHEDFFGWTAGAGIEYAFGQNWSARVEYLYANFGTYKNNYQLQNGTASCSSPPTYASCAYVNYSAQLSDNVVRFGLNYLIH